MGGIIRTFPPGSAQRQQAFQVKILIIWIGKPDRHRFQEAFLQSRQVVHGSCDSLENARLFQEVERLSTTDPLTGLPNRRFFNMAAQKLLQLSSRNMRPFSALMVDIDYFKRVNDTYGHAVGDKVLVAVTQACQQSVRGADLSTRYGGEEFYFLLSETSSKGALILAERLRTTIAALKIREQRPKFLCQR